MLLSACAIEPERIGRLEKRDLLSTTTDTFEIKKGYERWTYEILRVVKPTLKDGEKISGIRFGVLDGVDVYVSSSRHLIQGGRTLRMVHDGKQWKIGEGLQLMWRSGPNQALQPTRMLVTFRACARPAPSTRVADL